VLLDEGADIVNPETKKRWADIRSMWERVEARGAPVQDGHDLDTLYSERGRKNKGPTGKSP
jgi:hypothetical protein